MRNERVVLRAEDDLVQPRPVRLERPAGRVELGAGRELDALEELRILGLVQEPDLRAVEACLLYEQQSVSGISG